MLTKGILPKELRNTDKYSKKNEYGITLISINEEFRKKYEPNTSPYKDRIKALKYLHSHGLKTWVSMEPYPTPNLDRNQNLKKLLDSIDFVNKIIFGKLNYNVASSNFKGNNEFYEESADAVVFFCKKNKISFHIKFGTQKISNNETKKLFSNNKLS